MIPKIGDLVEYVGKMGGLYPRFGIVLEVKPITTGYQVEVLFECRQIFMHSRNLEIRCK